MKAIVRGHLTAPDRAARHNDCARPVKHRAPLSQPRKAADGTLAEDILKTAAQMCNLDPEEVPGITLPDEPRPRPRRRSE